MKNRFKFCTLCGGQINIEPTSNEVLNLTGFTFRASCKTCNVHQLASSEEKSARDLVHFTLFAHPSLLDG